ncbi:porin [Ancylobacter sp. GSK1Z-4-2]|uniref:Porin n=1 Tax=Ancylobacter mangrovi TaxID=2972472 RepID=A0A9X2T3K3_9HYPH|nr:porin [Ancylobacter mangrovi]MCS0493614.1 porin [Ancylobacter mangrovi]MCS0501768.1 porin [Ancylobacter mangrovi]
MKTVIKNALLGSVAGLAMVGTAAAADLPVKAKAAEYVKICSTYGAGFYYIPGSDTCLKIGGFVQTDYYYQDFSYLPKDEYQDSYFLARGALRVDARTQTEYGTLRSYFEYRLTYGGGGSNFSESTNSNLDKGYIQFAGFTFGKVQSFFDYYADNNVWGVDSIEITSDENSIVAAYTADFGNGFTATISIEDDSSRADGVDYDIYGDTETDIPALIGNINYEGEWGGFQISGMVRQLDSDYYGWSSGDDVGWAVLGGVKFNLPTFGEGDTLYIEGTYADGASEYTGINGSYAPISAVYDLYYNPVTDSYESSKSWTIAGELTHFFSPNVYGVVFGNYGEADIPTNTTTSSFDLFNVGASLNWSPVKGLLFVAQYTYGEANYNQPVYDYKGNLTSNSDFNQVLLSVRRTF